MASEQTLRDRDTVDDTKYMEGLDITVDVCSQPEFDIIKLHKDINDSVHGKLNVYLEDLIGPGSSVAIIINPWPSKKLSWTKNQGKTATLVVVINVNVCGHKDGTLFTEVKGLGSSIAYGVRKYVNSMTDAILTQFKSPEGSINEIKIETNIPNDDKSISDEYLTLNITINPASATITPKYEQRQEAERMKYAITSVCGTCRAVISGQSRRIACGNCSSEFHQTCVEIIAAESGSKAIMGQWQCSSCSKLQSEHVQVQPHTGTGKRKKKRAKKQG